MESLRAARTRDQIERMRARPANRAGEGMCACEPIVAEDICTTIVDPGFLGYLWRRLRLIDEHRDRVTTWSSLSASGGRRWKRSLDAVRTHRLATG